MSNEPTVPSAAPGSGPRGSRTRWITMVSIAAVSAAGALAVGANIGILDAADDTSVGTLAAAGDLTPPSTQVIDVYVDDTTGGAIAPVTPVSTTTVSTAGAQQYAVDAAGTVSVSATGGLVHLDGVATNGGWTWTSSQAGATDLTVTFTDGVRTLDFIASLAPDGTVSARVEEPQVVATPAAPTGGGEHEDDDDEYEGGDDDD